MTVLQACQPIVYDNWVTSKIINKQICFLKHFFVQKDNSENVPILRKRGSLGGLRPQISSIKMINCFKDLRIQLLLYGYSVP